mgnify:CR=1 FL=1
MIVSNGEFRVVLVTKDFKASTHFYSEVLGLPLHHDWDFGGTDCGAVYHSGSGLLEVLGGMEGMEYTAPAGTWVSMQVEDVDAAFAQVKAAGVTILEEPKDYPWGHRIAKIADPDGLMIWLFAAVKQE